MKLFLRLFLFLTLFQVSAQVGIGNTNPDPSSILDITSTDSGVLVPRMTQAQRTVISTPATGLLVYQTDNTTGFWYFNGTTWLSLSPGSGSGEFESNSGIVSNTTDLLNDSFVFGDSDLEGPGEKFFFDKIDAAFRAGQVSQTLWDNVGFGSIAMGIDNVAQGFGSISLGFEGSALGTRSIVLGNGEAVAQESISIGSGGLATGFQSIVLGNGAAVGDGSFAGPNGSADGIDAIAFHGSANDGALSFYGGAQGIQSAAFMGAFTSGFNSIAMMFGADAQGINSMAVGLNATSIGQNALAIGASSEANADNSVSLGSFGVADGEYSMVFGSSTSSGTFSLAAGNGSLASGDEGIALMGGLATSLKSMAIDGTANGPNSLALMGGVTDTFAGHSLAFGSLASTTGLNAIALGFNSDASGLNSVNLGADGLAIGEGSIVFGNGEAQGVNSVAGIDGLANGDNSFAFLGEANGTSSFAFSGTAFADQAMALMGGLASGSNALAFGVSSEASANNSICLGAGGIADGVNSIVLGSSSTSDVHALAAGNGSIASGAETVALIGGSAAGLKSMAVDGTANGDNSIALMGGVTNQSSSHALAFGMSSTALGVNSLAFGFGASANAQDAIAIGQGSSAVGLESVALMGGTALGLKSMAINGEANADFSYAFGNSAFANAEHSVAIGQGNQALGNASVALGVGTVAQGDISIAAGVEVQAYSFGETVFGYNNAEYVASSTAEAIASDHLFVVANNTSENAITVLKDGKMGLSRFPVDHTLEVEGEASKSTPGPFAGHSDARLKTNIQTLSQNGALNKLLQMRGVSYEWDDNKTGSKRPEGIQYGFVAQELMKIFPKNVKKDNLGYYQTAYGTYDALFVQSIKALKTEVDELKAANSELKKEIREIKDLLLQALE